MNLISYNQKLCLFSTDTTTFLYDIPKFQLKGSLEVKTKIGALQYATGIAALVNQSKVRMHGNLPSTQTSPSSKTYTISNPS